MNIIQELELTSRPKELKGLKPEVVSKAKDYFYSKIEFFVSGSDLFIKMSGTAVPTRWLQVSEFKERTERELTVAGQDLGRHFEDGIAEISRKHDLESGWFAHSLKRLVVSQ